MSPRVTQGALWLLVAILATALVTTCSDPSTAFIRSPLSVTLTADGQTRTMTTTANTVRDLLSEVDLTLSETDEVTPPLFTPLTADLTVRVMRVTESLDIIEQSIPFERKIVRNDALSADEPPRIIQAGSAGLQELTVRIVYRDGLEVERRTTRTNIIEEAQDEIVMIGLGAGLSTNVTFGGQIAYISGGNAMLMRGSSAFPETLDVGGDLDRRVFKLSPTGSHLLYTRVPTDTTGERFNSLWVIETISGRAPRPLGIDNVLWADWNPTRTQALQIAFSTGIAVDLLPGWEANNDLWLGDLLANEQISFAPERLVDSYPATYGWWGGQYMWSPDGRLLAYSYADEIGLIDLEEATQAIEGESPRQALKRFVDFNTRADWVWLPSLSWSPDSRYLAYSQHSGDTPTDGIFDVWVTDVQNGTDRRFAPQVGIWGYPRWSAQPLDTAEDQIAFLKSNDPLNSLRSSYTLWIMDTDGSNARQIYPPLGENSYFSRDEQFMAWGSTGRDLAFVFNDDLYILNLATETTYRLTQSETTVSHPTWAPYGAAVTATTLTATEAGDPPATDQTRQNALPEQ